MQCPIIDYAELAHRLRRQGLTQAQIGERLGIDQATVSRVMAGHLPDPRASVAVRLICAVGGTVTVPELAAEAKHAA